MTDSTTATEVEVRVTDSTTATEVEVRVTDSTTATETHGGVQDGSQSVVTAVEWGTDGPNTPCTNTTATRDVG